MAARAPDSAMRDAHLPRRARARPTAGPTRVSPPTSTMTANLPDLHLSYCTNIHPGESWRDVRENLERYLVPVRERVAPGRPFGVGLRLSGESARTLAEPGT